MNEKIENEVKMAYHDCWSDDEKSMKLRNLDFRASAAVSRDEAMELFKKYVPHGYNEFNYKLLGNLPKTAKVVIAREGSVCVYVNCKVENGQEFMADEIDPAANSKCDETRLWWD